MTEVVQCEILPHNVAKLTLNRPDVHNAIDEMMVEQLLNHFKKLSNKPEIRVILLTAVGKTFCAGIDLKWVQKTATYSQEENIKDAQLLAQLLETINSCPKPTIALIQGAAYGGGIGLIAVCDIAIAVEDAYFCMPEVKRGIIPAVVGPYVVNAIGQRQARRYMLTAERINAHEAFHLGLIHEVVGEEELEAISKVFIMDILEGSPQALEAAKDLIRFVSSRPIDAQVQREVAQRIAEIRTSVDAQEGIQAFLSKRRPSWVKI
jgi:methylglutaconyl-CoA hydratase